MERTFSTSNPGVRLAYIYWRFGEEGELLSRKANAEVAVRDAHRAWVEAKAALDRAEYDLSESKTRFVDKALQALGQPGISWGCERGRIIEGDGDLTLSVRRLED